MSDTRDHAAASNNDLSANDIRQVLLHMETAMRMLGKAIHRFSEIRSVHAELRHDIDWTNFEVQMRQSLANVKEIVSKV